MHIPTVTDEILAKVIASAASPVVVDFTHAGCREAKCARKALEMAADQFDDRIIFLRVWIEENPTVAARFDVDRPCVVVWSRGKVLAMDDGIRTEGQFEEFLKTTYARHEARRGQP